MKSVFSRYKHWSFHFPYSVFDGVNADCTKEYFEVRNSCSNKYKGSSNQGLKGKKGPSQRLNFDFLTKT